MREIDEIEAEFGKEKFLTDISGAKRDFLIRRRDALKRAALGKETGGENAESESRLYAYINDILGG